MTIATPTVLIGRDSGKEVSTFILCNVKYDCIATQVINVVKPWPTRAIKLDSKCAYIL